MEETYWRAFDIEAAKMGMPVMTMAGDRVEIIDFELNNPDYPIVGIVTKKDTGINMVQGYTKEGRVMRGAESQGDLVMKPLEIDRTAWVNLYVDKDGNVNPGNGLFTNKEDAEDSLEQAKRGAWIPAGVPVTTAEVRIVWQEWQPSTAAEGKGGEA